MKPIIIFDLDNVLINTERIKKDIFSIVTANLCPLSVVKEKYLSIRKQCFSPEKLIKTISANDKLRYETMRKIRNIFSLPRRYNYSGAEKLLCTVGRKYQTVLLTYGDKQFQKTKLKQSELVPCFEKVIITKDPSKKTVLSEFKKSRENVLVLDDEQKIISEAKKEGCLAIKVKKGVKNSKYYEKLLQRIDRALEQQRLS